jgi:hypothetical protein
MATTLGGLFTRVFVSQMHGCDHIMELFPHKYNFLFGASLSNPLGIFPIQPIDLNLIITREYDVQAVTENDAINTLPTYFAADAYANFGMLGWILFSFLYGLLLTIYDKIIHNKKHNYLFSIFFVWSIVHFKDLLGTGISALIFDHSFYALVLLVVSLSLLILKKI